MKEIIYNYDNLKEEEINRVVKRAKIVIENNKGNILLVKEYKNYQLPGGHIEDEESINEALIREIKEELGVEIPNIKRKLILKIRYLKKDFPMENINTEYIGYYFSEKSDIKPNLVEVNLTNEEKIGNFKLEFVNKKNIINKLIKNLNQSINKEVVSDTLEAITEHLFINEK